MSDWKRPFAHHHLNDGGGGMSSSLPLSPKKHKLVAPHIMSPLPSSQQQQVGHDSPLPSPRDILTGLSWGAQPHMPPNLDVLQLGERRSLPGLFPSWAQQPPPATTTTTTVAPPSSMFADAAGNMAPRRASVAAVPDKREMRSSPPAAVMQQSFSLIPSPNQQAKHYHNHQGVSVRHSHPPHTSSFPSSSSSPSSSFSSSSSSSSQIPPSPVHAPQTRSLSPSPSPTPPLSSPNMTSRPLCAVCKVEVGRCHASDPSSMQPFFSSNSPLDCMLNTQDWLCMKCYSRWYNKCKRKQNAGQTDTISAVTPPPQPAQAMVLHSPAPTPAPPPRSPMDDAADNARLLLDMSHWVARNMSSIAHMANSPALQPQDAPGGDANSSGGGGSSTTTPRGGPAVESPASRSEAEWREEVQRLQGEVAAKDEQLRMLLSFMKSEMVPMHMLIRDMLATVYSKLPMPDITHSPAPSSTSSSTSSSGTSTPLGSPMPGFSPSMKAPSMASPPSFQQQQPQSHNPQQQQHLHQRPTDMDITHLA
eukprot:TRINITY_DN1578_c1_g1_i1.p1 TRINITY_DN1578_c1_g1~~TRINITY_DN1578_c1_g1_i1.p1  ORF type:complete len:531 (-),score=152.77 TRINITY_DN1578_c1_g1_i1:26-1618(-)